jgi:hypothetical protein
MPSFAFERMTSRALGIADLGLTCGNVVHTPVHTIADLGLTCTNGCRDAPEPLSVHGRCTPLPLTPHHHPGSDHRAPAAA